VSRPSGAGGRVAGEDLLRLAHSVRAEVAEMLASGRAAATGPAAPAAEQARALAGAALERRAAAMLSSGAAPPDRQDEETVVELVSAMLFGLGAL